MTQLTQDQIAKLKKMGINITGEVHVGGKVIEGDQVNVINTSEVATPIALENELEKLSKMRAEAEKIRSQFGSEGGTRVEQGPLVDSSGDMVTGKRVTIVHKSSGENKG